MTVINDDTHSTSVSMHEPTGTKLVEITFPNDNRPFSAYLDSDPSAGLEIAADAANFDDRDRFQAFLDASDQEDDDDSTREFGRRSLVPDPWIQFAISNPEITIALSWVFWRGEKFLRHTVDESARKAGDAISDAISGKIRKWLGKYNQIRSSDHREVTSQVIIKTQPQICLLTRGEHAEQNTDIGIGSLCVQLELLKDISEKADSITFARGAKDENWRFLYMTTSEGKVIAPEGCYLDTVNKLEEIARTRPVCLCLKHKTTGEERHYETTGVFTPSDEQGRFRVTFNSSPQDLQEWEITDWSLLSDHENFKK